MGADEEDFTAHVRARFVETQYAALEQFRGEAPLRNYLVVVVSSWLNDYLVAQNGRWRPSAAAIRGGPVAIQLERLISRQGCTVDEAIARLLAGRDQPYTERELRAIYRTLPRRMPLRPRMTSDTTTLESSVESAREADATIVEHENDQARVHAYRRLSESLQILSPEDRVLVTMRFLDGQSVADIARALRVDQKPLYRRLEQALTKLKTRLLSFGVTSELVRDVAFGSDL